MYIHNKFVAVMIVVVLCACWGVVIWAISSNQKTEQIARDRFMDECTLDLRSEYRCVVLWRHGN